AQAIVLAMDELRALPVAAVPDDQDALPRARASRPATARRRAPAAAVAPVARSPARKPVARATARRSTP
ncbi:MAG: hypothetical protein KAX42_12525, partial [Sphaerotilus sp.]|nr:hypothetical protein [Sphaerotilus sp.]